MFSKSNDKQILKPSEVGVYSRLCGMRDSLSTVGGNGLLPEMLLEVLQYHTNFSSVLTPSFSAGAHLLKNTFSV